MLVIGRRYTFEAAHHLPYHDGHCQRLHGHSYKLEVEVTGEFSTNPSKLGMIMDYGDLDTIVKKHILDIVDHQDLNEALKYLDGETTAEHLAEAFFSMLFAAINNWQRTGVRQAQYNVQLYSVLVRETERSWAKVTA